MNSTRQDCRIRSPLHEKARNGEPIQGESGTDCFMAAEIRGDGEGRIGEKRSMRDRFTGDDLEYGPLISTAERWPSGRRQRS